MTQKNNQDTSAETTPRTQLGNLEVNQETLQDLSDKEATNIQGGRNRQSDDGGCSLEVGCHPDPTHV